MKSAWSWFLVLALLVGGCTGSAAKSAGAADPRATLERYLEARVAGDQAGAMELLVPEMRELERRMSLTKGLFQYQIGQTSHIDQGWLFPVAQFHRDPGKAWSMVAQIHYVVVQQEGKQMVDGARRMALRVHDWNAQVYSDRGNPKQLVMLEEGAGAAILSTADLPEKYRPPGACAECEFGVGREGFSAVALSPDRQKVAFVSWGVHTFVGVTTAVDPNVEPLALLFEGSAGELAWSLDGKYLASTATGPSGRASVSIWSAAGRKPVAIKGLPAGNPEEKVGNLRWKDGALYVTVRTEVWRINPATGEAVRA